MSSSDSTAPFVRTTGLDVAEETPSRAEQVLDSEVRRLRGKVAALEDELDERDARVAELEGELAAKTDELETARRWARFLDSELEEHRDRVETLEARVDSLEAESSSESPGLLARLRALF